MKKSILLYCFLIWASMLHAQNGTIAGKVFDKSTGESAFNAAVSIPNGKGTYTDFDGFYSLTNLAPGSYSIVVQLIGYRKVTISDVKVVAGKTTKLDIALETASDQLTEITVTAEAVRNSVLAIQLTQKNSSVLLEGVSSEQIRRMPDNNSADILKRTSGTTVENGKYIIVRGLNDRYNLAMVNGAIMPASEPDRKVFSFDLYPSTMIENMYVFKTAQADLPAEFAGGLVQIETRNFPIKNYINIQASTGANMGITFNEVDHYEGFSSDRWGGVADERKLPTDYDRSILGVGNRGSQQAIDLSRQFTNSWKLDQFNALPYLRLNLSGGLKKDFGKSSFGGNIALNFDNKTTGRTVESTSIQAITGPAGVSTTFVEYQERIKRDEVLKSTNWGGLLNLTYKFGANQITLNNSYSTVANNLYYEANGITPNKDAQFIQNVRRYEMNYNVNVLRVHQILGQHKFRLKEIVEFDLDWGGSLANSKNESPDLKRMRYFNNPQIGDRYEWVAPQIVKLEDGGRFYSELEEDNNSYFGNAKLSKKLFGRKQSLKFGAYYQTRDRVFDASVLGYIPASGVVGQTDTNIRYQPIEQIFSEGNIRRWDGTPYSGGLQLQDITNDQDGYVGTSTNLAWYFMLDLEVTKWLRAALGVRQESFDQTLYVNRKVTAPTNPDANPVVDLSRSYSNLLPSVNLIGKVNEKSNVRASYSQTVSRPEFRELAPFTFFDFDFFLNVKGDTNLVQATIQNVDLRYEYYLSRGQMISLSAYYKQFENPIEKALRPEAGGTYLITWINSPTANNLGLELSWRFDMAFFGAPDKWKDLVFFGNYSWIQSEIDQQDQNGDVYSRPMIGQSPFILNLGLDYHIKKWDADLVLLYNTYGRRIVLTGYAEEYLEPIYEHPRPLVDMRYSQRINDKFSVSITLKDLINRPIVFYQDNNFNGTWDNEVMPINEQLTADFDHLRTKTQPNREISIGLSYRL